MLIFTELLKKHNEQQPRFAPARPTAEPIVPPPSLTLAAAEQLNKRLVKLLADNSRRPHRSSAPSHANSRPASLASDPQAVTGAANNEPSQGSQHDFHSATTGGLSNLPTKQVSGTNTAAGNTTSEQYNTPQQSAEQPIVAVKLLETNAYSAKGQASPGGRANPQLEGQLERLRLEEISELLNQQRRRNLEQLQQLQPEQQSDSLREHSLRQAGEKSSNNHSNSERSLRAGEKSLKAMVPPPPSQPPASPATRPVRTAAMNVAAKVVLTKATKDSNAPSLAQTPTAAVGGSSLVNQNNAKAANRKNQKKISISKIIAEQTPNAFKTFVNVKNPGEHSGPGKTGAPTNPNGSALDTVPSDYEHIFHFPSSMAEERSTKVKYHEKKPDNRPHQATPSPAIVHPPPVKIVKNLALKQNKKPKRKGDWNQDNNKKPR